MKILFIGLAFIAAAAANGLSSEYLPPDYSGAASAVDNNVLEYEPAHTLADDGYRYKTVKRFRLRHRRDVNELSNDYLPPNVGAASESVSYSAPVEAAPAPVYAAPAAEATYEVAASEPAHTLSSDGYRYRTVKRYRIRRRRNVNELSNNYLPPHAGAASESVSYSAPAETAPAPVYSAPAPVYSAPAPAPEASFEVVSASEPEAAHTLSSDGYRYRTVKRYRIRRRRNVNELSNDYLPPNAGAASESVSYSAPVETAPAPVYAAPAAEATYEVSASEPAHTLSSDGYRYRTIKRYRIRRRRNVNELSNNYLPPHAGAASESVSYSAPAETAPAPVYSAPAPVYSAPAPAPEASFEVVSASEPEAAHTLSSDGYRYRTVKRYRIRRRRDVNELSNNYLPPHAGAASESVSYSAPAETAPAPVYSAPAPVYSAPAPAPEASFEVVSASEPEAAHTLSSDGYRYRTVKRYRIRRRRDVNELSNNYLPPHSEVATVDIPVYSAPAETAPAAVYAAPAAEATYEVAASEPAHELSSDGYRYRTVKRYRYRHRH